MVQRAIDILDWDDEGVLLVRPLLGAVSDPDLSGPGDRINYLQVLEDPFEYQMDHRGIRPTQVHIERLSPIQIHEEDEDWASFHPGSSSIEVGNAMPDFEPEGLLIIPGDQPMPQRVPDYAAQGTRGPLGAVPGGGLVSGSMEVSNPGATNHLAAPDDPAFQSGPSFSVSFWLRSSAFISQVPLVGKGINTTNEAGWNIGFEFSTGTSGRFWVETEGASNNSMGSSSGYSRFTSINGQYVASTWRHHTFVFDFSSGVPPTITQYINGNLFTTVASNVGAFQATRHDNTQPFRIFGGNGFYQSSNYAVTLNMIDVHFWADNVLTPADAITLYNGGVPLIATSGTLSVDAQAIYPLRSLSSLSDLAGNCPPLAVVGSVTESSEFP